MDWKTEYARKVVSATDALACVKSGDRVVTGHACGEPLALVDALVARAGELRDVEINHMVAMGKSEYCRPECAESFFHKSLFVGASTREAVRDGRGDYVPVFFSEIPRLFTEGYLPPDVALIQVSPPDKHGYCSFGISVDYTKPAAEAAKTVVAQVNPHMPRTHGDSFIHVSKLDFIVEADIPLIELSPPAIGDVEQAIGQNIAGLVEDGACLQLGHRRHPRRGAPLPPREERSGHPQRDVQRRRGGALRAGGHHQPAQVGAPRQDGRQLPHGHAPALRLRRRQSDRQHVPRELRQRPGGDRPERARWWPSTPRWRSICRGRWRPTPWGRCSSRASAARWTSCAGPPAAAGARPSSRCRRRRKQGHRVADRPSLAVGAAVTTMRADVDYVVTEYGVAHLRGKGLRERARALLDIAHPTFRDQITGRSGQAVRQRPCLDRPTHQKGLRR